MLNYDITNGSIQEAGTPTLGLKLITSINRSELSNIIENNQILNAKAVNGLLDGYDMDVVYLNNTKLTNYILNRTVLGLTASSTSAQIATAFNVKDAQGFVTLFDGIAKGKSAYSFTFADSTISDTNHVSQSIATTINKIATGIEVTFVVLNVGDSAAKLSKYKFTSNTTTKAITLAITSL